MQTTLHNRNNNTPDDATRAQAIAEPRAPRELRKLSERRASRKQHRTAGLAAASADFWVDPTRLRGDRDLDPELSQELLTLRQRISDEVLDLAAKHPNPRFSDDDDDGDEEDEDGQDIEQQVKAASTALQAFPHLRALQSFVQDLHKSTQLLEFEEKDGQRELPRNRARNSAKTKPEPSMDDFWEEIADASPAQRLIVLNELLVPQTMSQFVVATETFFHIRHLLADEDELYITTVEAHPLVSQLVLALEDSQPVYLPTISKLLCMFAKHKPLKRLMLQKQTVPMMQTRKRALREKNAVDALDQLLRTVSS